MKIRMKRLLSRVVAGSLVAFMMAPDAFAIMKEIRVWGARSINDEGFSDNRVSMMQLRDDYSDFRKTDGLREYFHKDQEDPYKADLTEALSWLIDNEIICRDQSITVSNIGSNRVPSVSISKFDVDQLAGLYVQRSDLIMYLYKAVYGPIDARTIGVETPNIRVENGGKDTLYNIMLRNKYFELIEDGYIDGIFQDTEGSDGGAGGTAGAGGAGGDSGKTNTEITTSKEKTAWRYTPQGDEYDAIFGDTNIFISQTTIDQLATGGDGGDGGDNSGGGGGAGGNAQSAIQYETDYKQIYYTPAADMMFYRTNDCLELYIRAALSKGILADEAYLRTKKFSDTFLGDNLNKTQYDSWNPYAPAYIVNRSEHELVTAANVKSAQTRDVLGVNFTINFSGSSLTLNRNNLFQSSSGYYSSERVFKMDIYRYIYNFIYANEKKLSELEADIVNYKYGMELDGVAPEEDVKILKYLIAKGIINFDSTADMINLYTPVTYEDFLPLLYRVAKPDARLDFSQIQLTDSDKQWRAKGYAPQTVSVVAESPQGILQVNYTDTYYDLQQGDNTEDDTENFRPQTMSLQDESVPLGGIRVADAGSLSDSEDDVVTIAKSLISNSPPNEEIAEVTLTANSGDLMICSEYNFSFNGAIPVNTGSSDSAHIADKMLKEYVDRIITTPPDMDSIDTYIAGNPVSDCRFNFINNMFVVTLLRNFGGDAQACYKVLDDEIEKQMKIRDALGSSSASLSAEDAAKASVAGDYVTLLTSMRQRLESNVNEETGPTNVIFQIRNTAGSVTGWRHAAQYAQSWSAEDRIKLLGNNLLSITYDYRNSEGTVKTYYIERTVAVQNESGTTNVVSGDTLEDLVASCNTVQMKHSEYISQAELDSSTEADIATRASAELGSLAAQEATADGMTIMQYTSLTGKDAFVSWSQIEAHNAVWGSSSSALPIERVSDLLLRNTETDTYAYFSKEADKKVALVGTEVVYGDDTLGVYFTSNTGEGTEYYYHLNAIRLLINAQQESALLTSTRSMGTAKPSLLQNCTSATLFTESGHSESSLTGLSVMISDNDKEDRKTAPDWYFGAAGRDAEDNPTEQLGTRWGNYLSLSQTNRVMNTISRRITYKRDNGQMSVCYAVVIFEPVDPSSLGTASVSIETSLQGLLDSVVQPPDNEQGKAEYEANMAACNVYANWIYGTSGEEYIKTGYLKPVPYIFYAEAPNTIERMTSVAYKGLNSSNGETNAVKLISMRYVETGAVVRLGYTTQNPPNSWPAATPQEAQTRNDFAASYYVSSDYRVVVIGDRVYLNDQIIPKLVQVTDNGKLAYRTSNSFMAGCTFTAGGTIKLGTAGKMMSLGNGMEMPSIIVTKTEDDGTIHCQVGPIVGFPVRIGNTVGIVDLDNYDQHSTITLNKYSLTTKPNAANSAQVLLNRLEYAKAELFKGYPGVTVGDACSAPNVIKGQNALVWTGSNIICFDEKGRGAKPIPLRRYQSTDKTTLSQVYNDLVKDITEERKTISGDIQVETYFEIEFSAFEYTMKDGFLTKGVTQTSDFLSPDLFSSVNDLIIDDMINRDSGAIPVNQIKQGDILKVGEGYYCAWGTDEDKVFVGYAPLQTTATGNQKPGVEDLAASFSTQFIRAGNQYLNVSHYFNSCEVLAGMTPDEKKALSAVATTKMSGDGVKKFCVTSEGKSSVIVDAEVSSTKQSKNYAPVVLKLNTQLMAYTTSSTGDGDKAVQTYALVNHAESAVSGAFADLPFFSESVLLATISDPTTDIVSAGYAFYEGALDLMYNIRRDFQKAFAGDLITLARMVLFVILIWLFVAGWLCYGFSFGNLMPILDAIKHPVKGNSGKGIDVFKIISLGTISLETEFKLGRFIVYEGIIALLLLLVWKTGNITLP